MKTLGLLTLLLLLSACWLIRKPRVWEVDELAQRGGTLVALWNYNDDSLYVKMQTIQKLREAHERITGGVGLGTRLIIIPGDEPNAYATFAWWEGKRVIAINTGMLMIVGDDIGEYAALLCHEAAHWVKGHVEWGLVRWTTLQAIGAAIDTAVKIPLGGFAGDVVDRYFSREDEREADSLSVSCMAANGYEPRAAVRLWEKLLTLNVDTNLTFLKTHPSWEERIENLKRLIKAQP